jgi:beta-lactamase regulating signal transducer with metallopeptidase domain
MIELSIVAKATAVAAVGLIGARLAGRTRASVRHLMLALTFGALIAMPVFMLAAPGVTVDVPVTRTAATSPLLSSPAPRPVPSTATAPALPSQAAPVARAINWTFVARAIWIAGAILFSIPLIVLAWRLRYVHRTGIPSPELTTLAQSIANDAGIHRTLQVIQHEEMQAPITFGIFQPLIVMPMDARSWNPEDVHRAIVHELEHVRRGDWAILVLARSVASVYWFHPLVWMAWRQLGLEAERSCDDAVLIKSESADYAEQLVSLAYRLSAANATPILGMANRSDLSKRVSSLLDEGQRRGRAGLITVTSAIAAAALVVVAVAPLRAVDRDQSGTGIGAGRGVGAGAGSRSRAARAIDEALLEAADKADLRGVNELLAAGADVNAVVLGDGTPLIVAARSNEMSIVRVLLDRGADPNLTALGDGSPLIAAAKRGALDIVELLVRRGANVNLIVPGDENALMNASEQGALDVVQYLVREGANVNERIFAENSGRDHRGEWRTAISQAAKNGHTDVVEYLKSAGARE